MYILVHLTFQLKIYLYWSLKIHGIGDVAPWFILDRIDLEKKHFNHFKHFTDLTIIIIICPYLIESSLIIIIRLYFFKK